MSTPAKEVRQNVSPRVRQEVSEEIHSILQEVIHQHFRLIQLTHLQRRAVIYVRPSSPNQVMNNQEITRR